jgi:hypothetical protein
MRPHRRPPQLTLIALCAAAVLFAGCGADAPAGPAETPTPAPTNPRTGQAYNGIEKLPVEEILDRTRESARDATSVRMWGVTPEGEARVDIRYSGADAHGTLEAEELGGKLELLRLGDAVYLKAPRSYWTRALPGRRAATYRSLAGRWVQTPADRFELFGDLQALRKALDPPAQSWQKDSPQLLFGPQEVPAVRLTSDTGFDLAVSTTGTPYPVALYFPSDTGMGGFEFEDWNEPVRIDRPTSDELVERGEIPAR